MARVVAVHGINNTFYGPEVMASGWGGPLLDGVALAGGRGLLSPTDLGFVFYGDVFRRPGRLLGPGEEEPVEEDSDAEVELIGDWWQEAARVDDMVPPPDARVLGPVTGVQKALAALAGSRFLAGSAERILLVWLRQVRAYFTDPAVRRVVQVRFAEQIGPDTEVVVAHSLGSVVAYEALCAHPKWNVHALVTLGSPLGVRNVVFDRLDPAPGRAEGGWQVSWPHVRSWTNISDRGDFVALVKKLGPMFGDLVTDIEVDNGTRMHDVTRYLSAPETGSAIAAGLRWGRVADGG